MVGLCGYMQTFSSCGEWGLLFIAVLRLLIAVASPVCGAWALDMWASVVAEHGLSSCGTQALAHWVSSWGIQA